jgi:hypothetical protein
LYFPFQQAGTLCLLLALSSIPWSLIANPAKDTTKAAAQQLDNHFILLSPEAHQGTSHPIAYYGGIYYQFM